MSTVALIAPDFALIVLGFVVARATGWGEPAWQPIEKIAFYVLFPALLFYSTAKAPLAIDAMLPLVSTMLIGLGAASIGLALLSVGAALRLELPGDRCTLALYWLAVKLLAVPAVALVCIRWLGLDDVSATVALLIAALPTATTTHVQAQRMGADGAIAALQLSLGFVLSAVTVPFLARVAAALR